MSSSALMSSALAPRAALATGATRPTRKISSPTTVSRHDVDRPVRRVVSRPRVTERGVSTRRRHLVVPSSYAAGAPSPSGSPETNPFDAMDFAEWFKTLKKAPWDEAPKTWKEFWAVRTQAAVIEMDVEKETVDAKEVEGIGLNPPKDKAEAVERIKTNAVYYRQNYLIATWAYALINCIMPRHFGANPGAVVFLLATGAALLCASDTLLGELSLWMKSSGKDLVWNATRVAGVDRNTAKSGLGAVAGLGLCAAVVAEGSVGHLLGSLLWGVVLSLAHAAFRPIDLKSTLGNLWKDVQGVQSKEEAAEVAKKGVKAVASWWKNRRPNEPTPVVMTMKGDPNKAAQQYYEQQQAAQKKDDEGVVDTDGWAQSDAAGRLPGGK